MKEIDQLISNIDLKIKKLIDLQQSRKEELEVLKVKNKELTDIIENQKEQIRTLEEKNRILKVSKTLGDNYETDEVKKKITELVREIDKCISLLNK